MLIIANKNDTPINGEIRAEKVMVIGPNGEKLGVKSIQDALTLASYSGLDLVLMSQNKEMGITKIMDYNKYRYEKQKQKKEQQKRQRETQKDVKEYKLSVTIDIHDFETRKKNAIEYLKKGHKIKVSILFKGRQMAHPELGREKLMEFAESVKEYGTIERHPKQEGRIIHLLITPIK